MTQWLGVVAAVLLPGAPEDAGKIEYVATVKVPEAEVRCGAGASDQLYSTNRLHKGDKVEVVKELEGGWLAIKPPAGSFSWINARFIQALDAGKKTWVVVAHPEARVPLLMGSDIRTTKPTVEGVSVVRGTQLRSIGPMKATDDGRWLPVEPPPAEVRYIRAEAVTRGSIVEPAPAAPVTADTGASGRVAAKPPQPAQPRPSTTPAAPVALPAGWVSSGPGRLVTAGRCIDYQRTYMLLNSQGLPIAYVIAPQGYSLESYLERNVEIYGVRQHSQTLRADYLTAMQVKLLP
jgi:hypothetical protein